MRRFVVLKHDHPTLHWDFLLEDGDHLRSWRLSHPPEVGRTVAAEPSGDHRTLYLDYEGPVSGNRGNVVRHAHGQCTVCEESDTQLVLSVEEGTLSGMLRFVRDASGTWTLSLEHAEL